MTDLRQGIYNKIFPHIQCLECSELVRTSKSVAKYYSSNYKIPDTIMLETTSFCNLQCTNCFNTAIVHSSISNEPKLEFYINKKAGAENVI